MRLMWARLVVACVLAPAGWAAASAPASGSHYGPLSFNVNGGGDFYFAQDGHFAPARLSHGAIEINLRPAGFQIGYNGELLSICLAQSPVPEKTPDTITREKISCLADEKSGAHDPETILVYSAKQRFSLNTVFADEVSKKTAPLPGYRLAYQVDDLHFTAAPDLNLANFRGILYGYIAVYKQHTLVNRNIMPIRLIVR